MKTEKAFMYMVGFDRTFRENCKTGWGNGYVAIPFSHRLAKKHFARIAEEEAEEDRAREQGVEDYFCISRYFEMPVYTQEITYTETKEIKGIGYLVVGWDTAHSYNNESHDFDYVFSETQAMLDMINREEV